MVVGDAYVFPGFLTLVLTQLFFPKSSTTFLTCFSRGERRQYAGKKSCLNWGSNSQPPGHESDMLTTEPPGRGIRFLSTALSIMCSISVCSFKLIPFMVWSFGQNKNGYFRYQGQMILEHKQLSKFLDPGAQLDIMAIHCGKFQKVPMESVGVAHTRIANGWTDKRTDDWGYNIIWSFRRIRIWSRNDCKQSM